MSLYITVTKATPKEKTKTKNKNKNKKTNKEHPPKKRIKQNNPRLRKTKQDSVIFYECNPL